jgi:hypothetical protein
LFYFIFFFSLFRFFIFPAAQYEYPKNKTISLRVIDSASGTVQTVNIPWFGVYVGDNDTVTFEKLNPIVEMGKDKRKKIMQEKKGGKEEEEEDNEGDKPGKKDISYYLKKMRSKEPINYELTKKTHEYLKGEKKFHHKPNADNDMITIIEDEENSLYMYVKSFVNPSTSEIASVGIIQLGTFLCPNLNQFLRNFGGGFYQFYFVHHCSDIIIDVRGNGGGEVGLEETLTNFLFGNTTYPSDVEMDFRKSDFLDEFSAIYQMDPIYKYGSADLITGFFYSDTVTKTFKYLNGSEYQKGYTNRYVFNYQDQMKFEILDRFSYDFNGFSPYDPQHVYVLTDGVCFSCCGIFTKTAKDTKSAKVLGVGYNPYYYNQVDRFETGSCPGVLMDSDSVLEISQVEGIEQFVDVSKFPKPFMREGVKLGLTVSEVFRFEFISIYLSIYI